ncbi:hypothetical protein LEP1GSC084_1285 [Leptospira interrogans serovar Medanensis str. L0448]|nr:hypothetical protein LEP1GSC099_2203 [Leptospira interrogans str. UI 08452]EMN35776.1 hypothetical protein LEP1GSC084_1285 [Leptospira interrogans serovar Medanensis str. L0448]TQE58179.1 hypothetical protein FF006_09180 [Leptospira interrogans]
MRYFLSGTIFFVNSAVNNHNQPHNAIHREHCAEFSNAIHRERCAEFSNAIHRECCAEFPYFW